MAIGDLYSVCKDQRSPSLRTLIERGRPSSVFIVHHEKADYRPIGGKFFDFSKRFRKNRVTVKGLISFAADNLAGADRWPGRKMMRPQVELNRKEAFGYAF